MKNSSRVIKYDSFRWSGVAIGEYKADSSDFKGVSRQTLIGEGDGETDLNFITRYFELAPGGYSTLEEHQHPHSVMVLRGRGQVVLGERRYDIEPYDCVYISPGTVHRFEASDQQPLGFICIVDRIRDRPKPLKT